MASRYPAECPVFKVNGKDREVVPSLISDFRLTVRHDGAWATYLLLSTRANVKPLTRAARELLAWSRQ